MRTSFRWAGLVVPSVVLFAALVLPVVAWAVPNDLGAPRAARAARTTIPFDAVTYDGHRYLLFNDSPDSWQQAQANCASLGGYLAAITSSQENDFLYRYVRSQGFKDAYFGGTDVAREGAWAWVNGERWLYSNWASSEPNNENGNEHYAMFYWKFENGEWNDGTFVPGTVGAGHAYLCEWGETAALTTPQAPRTVMHAKSIKVSGYLNLRETSGASSVLIYLWKKNPWGKWSTKGTVTASVADYEDYSKYSASVRLSSAGKWRLKAYHPAHDLHSSAWSPGSALVTVR